MLGIEIQARLEGVESETILTGQQIHAAKVQEHFRVSATDLSGPFARVQAFLDFFMGRRATHPIVG